MVAEFTSNFPVTANETPNPETPAPQAIGEKLNPQPSRQDTIDWLLGLERPPLPVAPAQDPYLYPKEERGDAKKGIFAHCPLTNDLKPIIQFIGKNPSYLDANGIPHLVSHGKYQKRQPTKEELDTWFANPLNGVGTLGSPKDIWLDFDVKNFTTALECKVHALAVAKQIRESSGHVPTVEETHSGGWRVFAGVETPPGFTNFALEVGGNHVGEALGAGRFTVLAPTIGPSGKPYVAYHRHSPETKPKVANIKNVGVYQYRKSKASKPNAEDTTVSVSPVTSTATPTSTSTATEFFKKYPQLRDKVFDLRDLGTDKTRDILSGTDVKGDRSDSLTTAVKDLLGWENWCNANGIKYRGDTRSLAIEAGKKMPPGKGRQDEIDEERVDEILKGIDASSCTTSCEFAGKSDEGCWNRILKLAGIKASRKSKTSKASSNAKVISLPTATPLPKAVGGNDNSPPLPPTYGGGSGGFDPDNNDVDWEAPVAYKGQLGYWAKPKKDEPPKFCAKCNFDLVVLKVFERYVPEGGEPSDPDGGGLQLKVTSASDGETKTVLISSQDYATAKTFTAALKRGLGSGIRCRISDYELQALLETKISEYHRKGGKVYTLASLIGQQPEGTWVFPKVKFSPTGQIIEDDTNLWVFNAKVSTTNDLPYPDIPKTQNVTVLKELIEAIREVAGVNWQRWMLALGWVAMQLNRYHIPESDLPILAAFGIPGVGKTRMALAALSLIWGVDEKKAKLRKTTESYLYEILSRLTVPFLWDDARATTKDERKVIDSVIVDVYGQISRRVRGLPDQTPHTSPLITSNPQLGDVLDAALSRLTNIFLPKGGVSNNYKSLKRLQNAKRNAPQAFSSVIGIGFNEDSVEEIIHTLMPHLAEAHERTPHHLALLIFYTQKLLELAGVNEDILPWVINEFCPDINDEQSGVDALTDFFERLDAAKAIGFVGDWNLRITSGSGGEQYLALYMPSIWQAIKRVGEEPSSYNKAMIERLLKEKGAKGGTVRLAENKLQVDTHEVGYVRGDDLSEMRNPTEEPRYCLKLPYAVFEAYQKPDDPVMSPPQNHITNSALGGVSVTASTSPPLTEICNVASENHITNHDDGVVIVPASTSTSCNVCNVVMSGEGGQEEKIIAELDASENSLTPVDAKNESQDKNSSPVSVPHITDITTLQPPSPSPETSAPHSVDVVMWSVMNSPCNEPYGHYTSEMSPDDWAEIHQFTRTDEYQQWLTEADDEEEWLKQREDLEVAFALDTEDFTDPTENEPDAQASTPNLEKLTPCANLSPAAAEVAQAEAVTPPLNPNLRVDPLQIPDWETTRGKEIFGGFHVGDRIRHEDGRLGVVCDPESDSTPCVLNFQDEPIWFEDLVPVWFDVYVIGYPVAWLMPEIIRPVKA
jgi:hypothetical protein